MKEKLKLIIIWLVLGLALSALAVAMSWNQGYSWSHLLCDGFFFAAVMLLGMGGLKFFRNRGAFDMMSYSISSVFQLYNPFAKLGKGEQEEFADYKERKEAQRKSPSDLLWAGLVYLVLAVS